MSESGFCCGCSVENAAVWVATLDVFVGGVSYLGFTKLQEKLHTKYYNGHSGIWDIYSVASRGSLVQCVMGALLLVAILKRSRVFCILWIVVTSATMWATIPFIFRIQQILVIAEFSYKAKKLGRSSSRQVARDYAQSQDVRQQTFANGQNSNASRDSNADSSFVVQARSLRLQNPGALYSLPEQRNVRSLQSEQTVRPISPPKLFPLNTSPPSYASCVTLLPIPEAVEEEDPPSYSTAVEHKMHRQAYDVL